MTGTSLASAAQDFQDDLDTWGNCGAFVILHENNNATTDLELSPEQVRVMFAALRDHAQEVGA